MILALDGLSASSVYPPPVIDRVLTIVAPSHLARTTAHPFLLRVVMMTLVSRNVTVLAVAQLLLLLILSFAIVPMAQGGSRPQSRPFEFSHAQKRLIAEFCLAFTQFSFATPASSRSRPSHRHKQALQLLRPLEERPLVPQRRTKRRRHGLLLLHVPVPQQQCPVWQPQPPLWLGFSQLRCQLLRCSPRLHVHNPAWSFCASPSRSLCSRSLISPHFCHHRLNAICNIVCLAMLWWSCRYLPRLRKTCFRARRSISEIVEETL